MTYDTRKQYEDPRTALVGSGVRLTIHGNNMRIRAQRLLGESLVRLRGLLGGGGWCFKTTSQVDVGNTGVNCEVDGGVANAGVVDGVSGRANGVVEQRRIPVGRSSGGRTPVCLTS